MRPTARWMLFPNRKGVQHVLITIPPSIQGAGNPPADEHAISQPGDRDC
jgi:hypothetical protein